MGQTTAYYPSQSYMGQTPEQRQNLFKKLVSFETPMSQSDYYNQDVTPFPSITTRNSILDSLNPAVTPYSPITTSFMPYNSSDIPVTTRPFDIFNKASTEINNITKQHLKKCRPHPVMT